MNAVADLGAPEDIAQLLQAFRNFFIRTRPKIPHSPTSSAGPVSRSSYQGNTALVEAQACWPANDARQHLRSWRAPACGDFQPGLAAMPPWVCWHRQL